LDITFKVLLIIFLGLPYQALASKFGVFIEDSFPRCTYKKKSFFISKDEKSKMEEEHQVKLSSRMGSQFLVSCPDGTTHKVFLDSHTVRTLNQTLLIEVKEGKLAKVKVLGFYEPPEYKPPRKWLDSIKKLISFNAMEESKVDGLSGATLTRNATLNSLKKILVFDNYFNNVSK